MDISSTLVGTFMSLSTAAFNTPVTTTEVQTASFPFTPYISQADACKQAEQRAKTLMLERTVGQIFTTDSSQMCKETNNELSCKNYNVSLETVRGEITEIVDRKEDVQNWQCRVTLKAKVSRKQEQYDPNFDVQIKMHQLVYMEKDTLRFSVTSNANGALSIFRLDPNNKLTKIWPITRYQSENNLLSPRHRMDFPNDFAKLPVQLYTEGQDNATTLFVAYTSKKVYFMDSYELTYFYKLWDSLNYDKRLIKKGYVVTRSE